MAANKCVVVLLPNGRRQNLKVTPNSTILQVLEEVCQKHGFNVDEYDIKHHNHVLDPNSIIRFTGLPNNAQLEMVACTKARTATNVTVGIQLESGERLMKEFPPDATLAQVMRDTCPDEEPEKAVLIYMHQEVSGKEALERTTLKSLGLNSGRAILRLIHRDLEQHKTQAHAYVPLTPKSSKPNDSTRNNSSKKMSSPALHVQSTFDPVALLRKEKGKMKDALKSEQDKATDERKQELCTDNAEMPEKMEVEETHVSLVEDHQLTSTSHEDNKHKTDADLTGPSICMKENNDFTVHFLGERNALLFSQTEVQSLPKDELPDTFFDLTVEDAKVLLKDAKRHRDLLEDAPLLTEAQRKFNEDKKLLDQLHKYQCTVIRIQFPDQLVLQGLFKPLETVQTVKDFVKSYLDDPDCEFTIYTAPPKHVLNPQMRLIDENLVPSAIVYYSGTSTVKSDVKNKLTNPKAAEMHAIKSRMLFTRQRNTDGNTELDEQNGNSTPGTSGVCSSIPSQNIPKWFKQSFQ